MNRSRDRHGHLLPEHSALQHERASQRAPRPLPLFLELVRMMADRDPDLARAALDGLTAYEDAERPVPAAPRPEAARAGPVRLRDHGGSGAPAILIPSLINPPHILDLDPEVSLASAIAGMGRHALLLDWGEARERSGLGVSGHVEQLLLPLLHELGEPAALVGYCLGGTMAIAAANLAPAERIVTLAAPWRFSAYPAESRANVQSMWRHSRGAAQALGALPMEVLQAAFWSLDPERTVSKFASFAALDPASAEARRFVQLEDWANQGEPLPCPAAAELIERFFGADLPGSGGWSIAGTTITDRIAVPALHFTADRDRITPAATAPAGDTVPIAAGHVGMIVGRAREQLHAGLRRFLDPSCR
ncbi:MAG TPA: alpha/beta hydrolase [Sphingomicrobium sp.]|nr:alpha/beta hydrolase [Sphingomicrobium sp.]